jgi:hypothetical protein
MVAQGFDSLGSSTLKHNTMNNPHQLNYTQQLEHRLRMIEDDLAKLVDFIDENNMMDLLEKPTSCCDSAWTHVVNMEHACDLSNDESLSWKLFSNQ